MKCNLPSYSAHENSLASKSVIKGFKKTRISGLENYLSAPRGSWCGMMLQLQVSSKIDQHFRHFGDSHIGISILDKNKIFLQLKRRWSVGELKKQRLGEKWKKSSLCFWREEHTRGSGLCISHINNAFTWITQTTARTTLRGVTAKPTQSWYKLHSPNKGLGPPD